MDSQMKWGLWKGSFYRNLIAGSFSGNPGVLLLPKFECWIIFGQCHMLCLLNKKAETQLIRVSALIFRGAHLEAYYTSYFLKAIVALWPPKPNELLIAALTSCLRAAFGT